MQVRKSKHIPEQDRDFFLLLRAGLWQRTERQLSLAPVWDHIYQLSCEQTVQGLIADGIAIYRSRYPETKITPDQNDRFLSATAQIVRQNYKLNQVQQKLTHQLHEAGIQYVILKGQGVGACYPKPMLRVSGDIDFYFSHEDYEKAKQMLMPLATESEDKPLSLECALTIDSCLIELHATMASGINTHCNQHFQSLVANVFIDTRTLASGIQVPDANFDALYILIHTIRHLGSFGISLRQVIDWTLHMHSCRQSIDRTRLQSDITAMHLQGLWDVFMSFAVEYLGMPEEAHKADSKQLASLWNVIKQSGSFGQNNPYFNHLHSHHLIERYFRIHYHVLQALKLRTFDHEFSNYLLRKELRDTFVSPFRFLFGGPTKITE